MVMMMLIIMMLVFGSGKDDNDVDNDNGSIDSGVTHIKQSRHNLARSSKYLHSSSPMMMIRMTLKMMMMMMMMTWQAKLARQSKSLFPSPGRQLV